jgi:hypothetical protein
LDVSEPPRIVFETTASCADGHQAEMALKQALSRARAPAPGWVVSVRIHKTAANAVQADGGISDERGSLLGHREFKGKPSDCDGLARAVGVWASLVLDAEIRRPRTASSASDEGAESAQPSAEGDAGVVPTPMPEGSLPNPPLPPDDKPSRADEPATYEMGIGTFVMSGIRRGNAFAGGTPFLVIAATKSFFFRPAVALGESLDGLSSTWGAIRLDGCFRLMGQYASHQALQLNLCGGVDVGLLDVAGLELPFVSPGPSLDLGGELGSEVSVTLRGIAGFDTARDTRLNTPAYWVRGELDLSWRLQ